MVCAKCGAQLAGSKDMFCSVCGEPAARPAVQPGAPYEYAPVPLDAPPQRKKTVALLAVLIAVIIFAAAAVWYFVLRDKGAQSGGLPPGSISSQDIGDEDSPLSSAARNTNEPPVRESGQSIRLPGGIFGRGNGAAPPDRPEELPATPDPLPEPEPETAPPEASYPPPLFWRAMSSGVTDSPSGRNYMPDQAIDGYPDTAWNVPGTGGEWIVIEADVEQYVTGIRILNGYTKYSPEYNTWLYYRNHRPKDITIYFSDETYMEWTLSDDFDDDKYIFQDIPLDTPKLTTYILIYIDSVYEGDRWDDTCISEIEVY